MNALIFLGLGVICGLIGRALIITAAFRTSVWWGMGVLVPFGPLLFRLSYPDDAQPARKFQIAALPCYFFYALLGPGPDLAKAPHSYVQTAFFKPPAPPAGFGLEKPGKTLKKVEGASAPATASPEIEQRRAANARELERLRLSVDALKLRKRDLLHSDVEGNRVYARDLAEYNSALAKANAEKAALAAGAN